MKVYIEYAIIENFTIDFALLYCSGRLLHTDTKVCRVAFSALIGAVFAVLFPLLHLTTGLSYLLKTVVGAWLCLLALGRVKSKKEWGRYALNVLCFFLLTFSFAGALAYLPTYISPAFVALALAFFLLGVAVICERVYKKSRIARFTYACTLFYSGNAVKANGYLDSGNLAKKSGLPVCFLSPDIFYALVGEAVALGARAEETLCVATVNGEKSYPLYKGEAEIEGRKKEVYFTVSVNMVTREYNVLLPYGIL